LFYGFATYGNAGWMREQVCKYLCPYARFQSAMFDADTLIVTYDGERGEPRAALSKKAGKSDRRPGGLGGGLGDCVDCGLCVQVCPTGIDIRAGLQYECIGCAACIDACNYVMQRAGMAPHLIRYATTHSMQEHAGARAIWRRVLRPRVFIYGGILLAVITAIVAGLVQRVPLKVDVINTTEQPRRYQLSVEGLTGLAVASESTFEVAAASTRTLPLRLQAPEDATEHGAHRIYIEVHALDDDAIAVRSMMNLCISFDHRINDGLPVARFLRTIKETLESIQDSDADLW
jgi:polyferredoxin